MRVTFLLVAFLAGAHSFKAVERRAVLMGKGAGGEVARSVVEDAIQARLGRQSRGRAEDQGDPRRA